MWRRSRIYTTHVLHDTANPRALPVAVAVAVAVETVRPRHR
jgi:hypothetical protein